jgi:Uma2 family endonuclease
MAVVTLDKPHISGLELPYEDSIPLESSWHLDAMYLLIQILSYFWRERADVYLGGNMFVYFDPEQVKTRNFRGPDFFVVKGVKDNSPRKSWVVWEEEGLTPDFVIELASISTAKFDQTDKKDIYQDMLQTAEYIIYNPETGQLRGWRLKAGRYVEIKPNVSGWLWCEEIGLWLGVAEYHFLKHPQPLRVLRFFDQQGQLVPTKDEAEAEARQAAEQRVVAEIAVRRLAEERADAEGRRAAAAVKAHRRAKKRANTEAKARRTAEERAEAEARRVATAVKVHRRTKAKARQAEEQAQTEAEARQRAEEQAKTLAQQAQAEAEARRRAEERAETLAQQAQAEAEARRILEAELARLQKLLMKKDNLNQEIVDDETVH